MKIIAELHGVRGVAILLVIIWHYLTCQIIAPDSLYLFYIKKLTALSWSGVDLFFVLSGFFIIGSLIDKKGEHDYYPTFFFRRAIRILPLYFALLIFYLILPELIPVNSDWLYKDSLPFLSYITFTQNFFMAFRNLGPNFLGITWAIAVLVQFYLIVALIVRRFNQKQIIISFIVLILAAPLFRSLLSSPADFVLLFTRSDSLFLGGIIALTIRNQLIIKAFKDYLNIYIILLATFFLGGIVLTFWRPNIGEPLNHFWLSLLYGLLVMSPFVMGKSRINIILKNKILVWLRARSFGIFLFHQAVSGIIHTLGGNGQPEIKNFVTAALTFFAFFLTLTLVELSYRYFEQPLLKYCHK